MHKSLSKIIIFLFASIILTSSVIGVASLSDALKPLQGLHIVETYNSYYQLIDSVFYFIIFIGVAKVGFGEKFKESNVPTIMGIILGIAMTLFEYQSKFKLGNILIIVAIVAIIYWVYTKIFGKIQQSPHA